MKQLMKVGLIGLTAGGVLLGFWSLASAQAVLTAQKPPVLVTPEGRLLIGRGKDYVPSTVELQALFSELEGSMKKRRDFAWKVAEQVLQPVKIKLLDGVTEVEVPLWHTWFEGRPSEDENGVAVPGTFNELDPLFKLYFKKLKPVLAANPNADVEPVIKDTIKDFSTKDLSSSLTNAQLSNVLHQHVASGMAGKLLGQGTTVFSPSFIEHVLRESRGIDRCTFDVSAANDPPPSPTEFSPCMKEFPRSAVLIKTSWKPLAGPEATGIPVHDTSAAAMKALIEEGTWPGPSHTKKPPLANPERSQIYTNITQEGQEWALVGVHFVTKDVREWVWVSLWWDPDATKDFGADRPAQSNVLNSGVWKNYKMCVASSFNEGDGAPWSHYTGNQQGLGTSIKAVHDAIVAQIKNGAMPAVGQPATFQTLPNALGPWPAPHNAPTTWCSNPNVETHPANGRTSCIGCHQIAFTKNEARNVQARFSHAMFGDFPQFGRSKVRNNFPAEFSWSFEFEFKNTITDAKKDASFEWPAN
jgi:hypothetical protein